MSRSSSSCRQCRRERQKLFLKGERCFTAKCAVERRNYPPGQHGAAKPRFTEYSIRLREKQKARRIYGIVEKQFRKYFEIAAEKSGVTGDILLELLERRLDNVVFRLGYAPSRQAARQLVRHGHVKVNGKKVNIPSYQVKINEEISLSLKLSVKLLDLRREALKEYVPPAWLTITGDFQGKVVGLPTSDDIEKLIQVSLIVEHYSK
ncbi:30S ribosomal protein S4 [candidate division WOR-1 bacterium RIFOXYC2_FULL_37_10]|uniref:Small ribosomal subunit protein uS4 n=1 Tax=candidate division WOR-1 bacterium RIFOXYB2_FULL_37_13 TaxID=1802579 RepID=A0A1F4SRZ9_UNCSA|nr:MAG: 30S ribosomal protein S4 [candidate division WOR-1 bacterium RIFOXYA2_FULL_37_7]OGC23199.1 MAG: 30S ribosomal protein S4 [candidate division WOR-1 bacterium RIFOXYB2_FULL_37_13]OGC37030.1 MAG: 30S ribosomal protein S4 [candidate division WOR-1 bacterium RIFOXYC2_FULL_37_10]